MNGRPKKKRIVAKAPVSFRFSPRGKRGKPESVMLRMEGYEALRLADYRSMTHVDAAKRMNVSRQTFERILKDARRVVSDAIVNGKGIKIWGGSYDIDETNLEG